MEVLARLKFAAPPSLGPPAESSAPRPTCLSWAALSNIAQRRRRPQTSDTMPERVRPWMVRSEHLETSVNVMTATDEGCNARSGVWRKKKKRAGGVAQANRERLRKGSSVIHGHKICLSMARETPHSQIWWPQIVHEREPSRRAPNLIHGQTMSTMEAYLLRWSCKPFVTITTSGVASSVSSIQDEPLREPWKSKTCSHGWWTGRSRENLSHFTEYFLCRLYSCNNA